MRACELELLRANGAEPCLLMDTGGETGRISFSEAGLALRSNPNLLDNWDFIDPVNQKRQTEYTENGYTIDRWYGFKTNISLGADYLTVTFNSIYGNIRQILEALPSGTYTLSFLFAEQPPPGLYMEAIVGSNTKWLGDANNILSFATFTVNEKQNATISLTSSNTNAVTAKLRAAKLELGPHQTLAHQNASGNWVLNDPPPNKALELLKCQKYQYIIDAKSIHTIIPLSGFSGTEISSARASFTPPVPLRINPTISFTGNWYIGRSNTEYAKVTDVNWSHIDGVNIRCAFTCEKALNNGPICFMTNFNSSPSTFIFDANLL